MRRKAMVGAGVFTVLAVLFGVLDLEISKAFVNPDDPVARTLEVLGECTTPVLGMLSLAMLFLTPPSASRAGQVWLRVGAFLGAAGLAAYLFLTLPGYFGASFFAPAALLGGAAVAGMVFLLCSRIPREWREKYLYVAAVCAVTILVGLALVEVLKALFGRVRFREMAEPYGEFTRWFVPKGYTGSKSFPSGHTAHAASLFGLLAFCDYPQHRGKERVLTLCFFLWTLLMAVYRVRIGAHFASDVLFGGTLMFVIATVVRAKLRPRWQARRERWL